MYICLCKGITDKQIRQAIQNGAKCMRDLHDSLGIAKQCGKCSKLAKDLLKEPQLWVNKSAMKNPH